MSDDQKFPWDRVDDKPRVAPSPEEEQRILDHWAKVRPTFATGEPKRQPDWWGRYNAYLGSPEWEARRQKVLTRSPICESCGEAKATQVHHLSYSRVGREALWDLRAVCASCHEALHSESEDIYPVAPVMVSAAEWLYGARTWIAHIHRIAKTRHTVADHLVEIIGTAADRLKHATPVETHEGRAEAYRIWLAIWMAAQELETGARPIKIENYYLPKRMPLQVAQPQSFRIHVQPGKTDDAPPA